MPLTTKRKKCRTSATGRNLIHDLLFTLLGLKQDCTRTGAANVSQAKSTTRNLPARTRLGDLSSGTGIHTCNQRSKFFHIMVSVRSSTGAGRHFLVSVVSVAYPVETVRFEWFTRRVDAIDKNPDVKLPELYIDRYEPTVCRKTRKSGQFASIISVLGQRSLTVDSGRT